MDKVQEAKKTTEELLQELITLTTPIAEMASYNIQKINDQIAREKVVEDFIKKQREEQEQEQNKED